MSYKRIGDYIRIVSNRNANLITTNLMGVNILKNFMPSVANTSSLDLSKYKLIEKGQFATNLMHVNRDEVLPVALYRKNESSIVSPAYITFEVVDESVLLSEFLMIEFQRPEFDRRAWTYCDSSVRGGLKWERFCDISRNGEKFSIALLAEEAGLVVSSTYTIFRSKDTKELLPEYLMLWFRRPEFDRYARFHSWGSARETFDWADMCNVKLPIPDIEVQKAIVTIYHTLETRKRINGKLKDMIKPLCPVLMRGVVENMKRIEN